MRMIMMAEIDMSLFNDNVIADIEPAIEPVIDTSAPTVPESLVVEPVVTPIEPIDYGDTTPREKLLLEQLERVTGEQLDIRNVEPTPEVATVEPIQHNFLEGLDVDEILSSAENLNKLLVAVHDHALAQTRTLAAEQILQNLPEVISTYVVRHIATREKVADFYKENPDLVGVKRTLATVANEITAEKPELTLDQVFEEAATRTRTMLGLKKSAPVVESPNKKPSFVNSPRARIKVPELAGVAAEVSELFNI